MKTTERNGKRSRSYLTATEKTVIYGLIILVAVNAQLGITDNASLAAIEDTLENNPQSFIWPLVLLSSTAGLVFLRGQFSRPIVRSVFAYASLITFAIGITRLAALISY